MSYTPTPGALQHGLAKLGGADAEAAFIEACDPRKNFRRSRDLCCARWKLSYEEYDVLREHFAPRIATMVMRSGFVGNFAASSLPPGDRE